MMRMLEAGGVPLYYDQDRPLEFRENGTDFINYNVMLRETERLNDLKEGNGEWLKGCKGKAVKILTPAETSIPKEFAYRFVWMDRKVKHCVNSNRKFMLRNTRDSRMLHMKSLKEHVRSADREQLAEYVRTQRQRGLKMLMDYPNSKLTIIEFERMLKNPRFAAVTVARFLERELDIDAMAKVVVKRPAHCLLEMLEEKIYAN